jgi:putative ABC transport system permease protein
LKPGCWADDDFKVFEGFKFIEGTPEHALEKPDNIILTEKTARKIFGNEPALGKIIISDKYSREVFTVGGVIRIPEQNHIEFGFMLSDKNSMNSIYSNTWGDKGWIRVYIMLRKDAVIDHQFISEISNHISRYSKITDKLMFQPLADIHLYSDYDDFLDKRQCSCMSGSFQDWRFSLYLWPQ